MRIGFTHGLLAVAATAALTAATRFEAPHGPKTKKATVVTVTATDYAFQAPDSIEAGRTTLRLVNKGADFHHIWLVKLEQGKRLTDLVDAMKKQGPLPAWAVDVGGPNSPVPGGANSATLDLQAGRYAMVCVIPAMKDGQPHLMKGMVKEIVVTPRRGVEQAGKPAASSADVVMTLSDYDFVVSAPITSATRTIRFRNTATQTHEAVFLKLNPGATAQSFLEALEKPNGPPPGVVIGGITGIANGRTIDIAQAFTPGKYVLVCFVPDSKDGKPHVAHGMVKEFVVQ